MNVISTAANEYYRRPADEIYPDPAALVTFSQERKAASREISYNAKDLSVVAVDDRRVQLASPRGAAELTPWSHAQLCRTAGAPAGYVRSLPAPIQADALNHGLRSSAAGTTLSILAQLDSAAGSVTARAVTSETYGRLWDADMYGPIVDGLCAQGWSNPPTWDGKPAGSYASDRDSFLVLVNGGSIVNDPSVRSGNGDMYRGIILKNSEVGAAGVYMDEILYQFVCGNHNFWGAVLAKTYRRRHVGTRVLRDVLRELGSLARSAVSRPASVDEILIKALIDRELASTQDACVDELVKMGATKQDAIAAYKAADQTFDASPRSFWGLAQGFTRISQESGYQDDRMALDQLAAKVLSRGRVLVAA